MCIKFLAFFLQFRDRVITNYPELFEGEGGEQLSAVSQFATKWGWYQSIYTLANGDITRFEDITQLNIHKCLLMLAFMKEKADIEMKQIKTNR